MGFLLVFFCSLSKPVHAENQEGGGVLRHC
jgi:hypothetical protein